MNKKTRELVLAAILTALSIIITYSPLKIPVPYTTVTLGSHIPTMISMFISPWVILMTVIGNCIGYAMVIPPPSTIIVVARAATHLIFALIGHKMIFSKKVNIYLIVLITGILHTLAEGVASYLLTPLFFPENAGLYAAYVVVAGTFVHHLADCAVTAPIVLALRRAKILNSHFSKQKEQETTNA